VEVLEPLLQRDGTEPRGAWKIEADSRIAVRDSHSRGPGSGRFTGRRFGTVPPRPVANQGLIIGRHDRPGGLIIGVRTVDTVDGLGIGQQRSIHAGI
jgi:hypothetical protein